MTRYFFFQLNLRRTMELWKVFNEKFQVFTKYFSVSDLLHWLQLSIRFLTDLPIKIFLLGQFSILLSESKVSMSE